MSQQHNDDAIVIITSNLTDTRHIEARLKEAGRPYRIETMGMGDAEMRRRFKAMCDDAGRHQLPLVRQGERWIGGEYELLAELDAEHAPTVATTTRWIGYAGLIPFVLGALAQIQPTAQVTALWLAYATIILAFMAGTQWGAGLRWRAVPYSWWIRSVAAPLVAWPLVFAEATFQAYGLALLFGAILALDQRLEAAGRYPDGYYRLRMQLTAVATISLVFGALAMDW